MKKIVIKIRESDGHVYMRAHDGADYGDALVASSGLLMQAVKMGILKKDMAQRLANTLNKYAEGKEDDEA